MPFYLKKMGNVTDSGKYKLRMCKNYLTIKKKKKNTCTDLPFIMEFMVWKMKNDGDSA